MTSDAFRKKIGLDYLINSKAQEPPAKQASDLATFALQTSGLEVLRFMKGKGSPATISDISAATKMDLMTVLRVIQYLLEEGLVASSPAPSDEITLTESGQKVAV